MTRLEGEEAKQVELQSFFIDTDKQGMEANRLEQAAEHKNTGDTNKKLYLHFRA